MYTPPHFAESDLARLHDAIEAVRLAILVTFGSDGIEASHVPMLLDRAEGERGTITGHIARANPQWRRHDAAQQGVAIFTGPEACISPSWFPSKPVDGKVVPTWNYVAIHATGPVEFFDDEQRLRGIVGRLTDRYEAGRPEPWAMSDAPEDYLAQMLKGIVGFRMPIAKLEGKWKLSQNKSAADQAGIAEGLETEGEPGAAALADLMRRR